MDVRVGLWRKLSAEELMLLNCGVEEDCWESWTARRSSQSILKEISPEYSLEGLMLKLKLQYFGHLMRRVESLEKDSDAGSDWGQEEKGTTEDEMAGWHHRLDGLIWVNPGAGDGQGGLACCNSWGRRVGYARATELNWIICIGCCPMNYMCRIPLNTEKHDQLQSHLWLRITAIELVN